MTNVRIMNIPALFSGANSPSRAGTETTLLFAPTTSSRNYRLLHWKCRQILILGRGTFACESLLSYPPRDFRISRATFRMHESRRVTSRVMQSRIAGMLSFYDLFLLPIALPINFLYPSN